MRRRCGRLAQRLERAVGFARDFFGRRLESGDRGAFVGGVAEIGVDRDGRHEDVVPDVRRQQRRRVFDVARDVARVVDDDVPLAGGERLEVAVAIAVQLLEVGEAAGVGLAAIEERQRVAVRARGGDERGAEEGRCRRGSGSSSAWERAAARRGRRVMAAAAASEPCKKRRRVVMRMRTPRARQSSTRARRVDDPAGDDRGVDLPCVNVAAGPSKMVRSAAMPGAARPRQDSSNAA